MNPLKKSIKYVSAVMLSAGALFFSQTAEAGKDVIAPTDSWEYSLVPNGWLAALEGSVGVGPTVTEVDASFSDLVEVLDMAGYLAFEAHKGNWGYFIDLYYIKLSASESFSLPRLDKVSMGVEQFRGEFGITYRVYHDDKTTVNIFAGGQYTYLELELEIAGVFDAAFSGSKEWIDPVIGFQARHDFNERWFCVLAGEVGGFGISSDRTWQALGTVGYQLNDCWSLIAGYRHQYIKYDRGDFLYDTDTSGPVIGGVFSF